MYVGVGVNYRIYLAQCHKYLAAYFTNIWQANMK